jgi:endo-1,4-beta-xylanase
MIFKISGTSILFSLFVLFNSCTETKKGSDISDTALKNAYNNYFLFGTSLNKHQLAGNDTLSLQVSIKHFNAVTAENDMKWENIHPLPDQYNFEVADKLVDFAEKNNMFLIGHTLIWHSQTPDWVFEDENGNLTSRDTLLERMKDHIYTIVGRYKGKVHGWDVVNEAINDDGTLRQSKWMQIIGEDYIQKAFEFAHQADTAAELYYNDYSMTNPLKRKSVVQLIKNLNDKGIKTDGIGMQAHYGLEFPKIEEFEQSIIDFASTGAKVMLTELDVSVLPFPSQKQSADISLQYDLKDELNPFVNGLPDSVETAFINQYTNLFKICIKHKDKISRISMWGINDGQSWKNDWPISGRTDYPLLFDRKNQPKKVVNALIKLVEE